MVRHPTPSLCCSERTCQQHDGSLRILNSRIIPVAITYCPRGDPFLTLHRVVTDTIGIVPVILQELSMRHVHCIIWVTV
jgi:hypothetical protein